MRSIILSILSTLLFAGTIGDQYSQAAASEPVSGVWFNDTGRGAIELYPCNKELCGKIVWLREPLSASGRPLQDRNNPEPSRRGDKICGLEVIAGIEPQNDGTWDGGRIYDPQTGKTYNVAIERLGPKQLRITGYLGIKLLGKSFVWQRAPQSLPRCQG